MDRISQEERKNRILKAVIDDYSVLGRPVASRTIVCKVKYSSATIRHVMAELEEIGYLKKIHHSAGRIPTDEGYRFYVDRLMEPRFLTMEEEGEVEKVFEGGSENLLNRISFLLSRILGLLGIVLSPDEKIFISGRPNIFVVPEFTDLNKIKRVFEFLESEGELLHLLSKGRKQDNVCVLIGKESGYETIKDCSIAMASYATYDGRMGVLGVIGPTRMRYFRVIPAIEFISKRLTKALLSGRNGLKEKEI